MLVDLAVDRARLQQLLVGPARRVSTLARLAAPYKRQTALAIVSLLAATLTALAPPYLAKLAIDNGIRKHDLGALTIIVVLDEGRIVARGTHDDLAETSTVYRDIYEHGLLERQFADAVEARGGRQALEAAS